jgi:hypothetical protein
MAHLAPFERERRRCLEHDVSPLLGARGIVTENSPGFNVYAGSGTPTMATGSERRGEFS